MQVVAKLPQRTADLTGRTLSGWLVVSFAGQVKKNGIRPILVWKVKCPICGQNREFQGANLKGGRVAKCDHVATRTIDDLQMPHYAPIPAFPGYIAGDDGSIWSCHIDGGNGGLSNAWRLRRSYPDKDGYPMVVLRKNRRQVTRRLSHCILESFVGPCPDGMEACHCYDPDPANNRLDNLRWDTHRSNINDKLEADSQAKGESHGMRSLSDDEVMEIRRRDAAGESPVALSLAFGVDRSHIWQIVVGRCWKHLPLIYTGDRRYRNCPRCGVRITTAKRKFYEHVASCAVSTQRGVNG